MKLFDINVLYSSLFVESTAQQYKQTRGTKAKKHINNSKDNNFE